jgi:hypothetical protein
VRARDWARRSSLGNMLTATAAVLLAFPFAILAITSALFAVGVPISWFQVPAAAAVTAGYAVWLVRARFQTRRTGRFLLTIGVAGAAFAICVLIEAAVYDLSWDGQTYHALAIQELADGWNPVRGSTPEVPSYSDELHYFAKGPWLLAASIYQSTGSFEGGKAFHLYLMLTAYLFWVGGLLSYSQVGRLWAFAASVPIALNPVSGAQVFTQYVDGQLASLIAIIMALLLLTSRRHDAVLLSALAMAMALAIGTKLNGALYVVIIAGGFWVWRTVARAEGRALGVSLVVGVVVGVGLTGYNPYTSQIVAGTITHGNPFHPHPHWSSFINLGAHQVVPGTSGLGRMAHALVARSAVWPSEGAEYKVPFTFSPGELKEFASADVRLGGHGPLFSGALILTLAALILLLRRPQRFMAIADLLVLAGLILVSVLPVSEAWWARLAPHLGFVPVLLGVAAIRVVRERPYSHLPRALIIVLCVNSVLVFTAHASLSLLRHSTAHRELVGLREAAAPLPISNLAEFPGLRQRLERVGIGYYDAPLLPCPEDQWQNLGGLDVYTCASHARR